MLERNWHLFIKHFNGWKQVQQDEV